MMFKGRRVKIKPISQPSPRVFLHIVYTYNINLHNMDYIIYVYIFITYIIGTL